MGKDMTTKLHKGINPSDVVYWLDYVREYWLGLGINLDYKWRPVKVNGGFVRNMMKVVVGRSGNYVLFGMATRKNGVYAALVTRFAGGKKNQKAKKEVRIVVPEEEKMKMYVQVARKCARSSCDHAMGLKVTKSAALCFNNGSVIYRTVFCAENMAKLMIGLSVCYVVDLFEEDV
jgi:hypothetical protein